MFKRNEEEYESEEEANIRKAKMHKIIEETHNIEDEKERYVVEHVKGKDIKEELKKTKR